MSLRIAWTRNILRWATSYKLNQTSSQRISIHDAEENVYKNCIIIWCSVNTILLSSIHIDFQVRLPQVIFQPNMYQGKCVALTPERWNE